MNSKHLNGPWQLRFTDGFRWGGHHAREETADASRYLPAQVPGCVHADLLNAGYIPEPTTGMNALASRWVEQCIWTYRREFTVSNSAVKAHAWLVFDQLDIDAQIYLNGEKIGEQCNAFHPCRVEVTGRLKAGKNVLAVDINSGVYAVTDKPSKDWSKGVRDHLCKRHWLRKPQCQFGWDWGPWLLNVGISGAVRLEWTKAPARVDAIVPLVEWSKDLSQGRVRVRAFIEGLGKKKAAGTLNIELPGLQAKTEARLKIEPGLHMYETEVSVENPEPWWPVGQGKQKRYALNVRVTVDGKTAAETSKKVGFRHVRVIQDPHPEKGAYFIVEINGRKTFLKGANFVPSDVLFSRIGEKRYKALVDGALEANFNFLRVWGGGMYESDAFYDYCDRKGVLVWQEFCFACGRYPLQDETFYRSVRREAEYNIRRLAEHPSLIIWCGNNELEWANWDWGYDTGAVHPDHALFHITLPRLLAEEDPTRFYWPSSPYSAPFVEPNAHEIGDQHAWGIGMGDMDFRHYRDLICRFPNEGGFLGPTALPTMKACLPEDQQFNKSHAWLLHNNTIEEWKENPSFQEEFPMMWLGRRLEDMSVEEYTFWVGLLQGEALREYIENFRRRMFDSACAVFWMHNDIWPSTRTWSIIDYYLRRTPMFWSVRRACEPVHVVIAEDKGRVRVFGINDTQQTIKAQLRYGVMGLAGGYPVDEHGPVELPPNASTVMAEFNTAQWKDPRKSMAFALLTQGDKTMARGRLFLPLFKEMKWRKPDIRVRLKNGRAVFESDVFVLGVCIDLDGERALDDNFFDLWPGMPHSIAWSDSTPPKVLYTGNVC